MCFEPPWRLRGLVLVVPMVFVGICWGQEFPAKPIRIITTGVGGDADFAARILAREMPGAIGQPVVVENRQTGVIPGQLVSQAPPDGYTLLCTNASLWTGTLLQKTPYDVERDFAPISLLVSGPSMVVVHPSLPVRSIKELIALAKARPGELNYSSTANGTGSHLAGELFKSMAGINIVRVAYSGGAGASSTAMLAGETQVQFAGSVPMAYVKSGRLRALAVTSLQPSPLFPGLPTVSASGLPGYEAVGRTSLFAPAKTPSAIVTRLNQDVVRVITLASSRERFFNAGVETVGSSPEELGATVRAETAKWSKVLREAGIKAE